VIGLVRGGNRAAAIAGLVIGGLSLLFLLGFPILMALCR